MLLAWSARGAAQSPTASTAPAATWKLVEEWRLGEGDDKATTFAEIRGLAITKAGHVFVLDFTSRELRQFDARGHFLRVVARKGSGPGELQSPTGVAIGDNDEVVVSDPGQDRFSMYSANGKFLRQLRTEFRSFGDFWSGAIDPAGRVLDLPVRVPIGGVDPRTQYPRTEDRVRRITINGAADTLSLPKCGALGATAVYRMRDGYITSLQIPFSSDPQVVVTRRGTVWCSPRGEYRLLVGALGSSAREVVHFTVKGPAVSAAQRREAANAIATDVREFGGTLLNGDPDAIPSVAPAIARLFGDDVGGVWVQRSVPIGAPTALDVFDATGRWIGMIRSSAQIGQVTVIAGNALVTAILGPDDVPLVVRYRIVR